MLAHARPHCCIASLSALMPLTSLLHQFSMRSRCSAAACPVSSTTLWRPAVHVPELHSSTAASPAVSTQCAQHCIHIQQLLSSSSSRSCLLCHTVLACNGYCCNRCCRSSCTCCGIPSVSTTLRSILPSWTSSGCCFPWSSAWSCRGQWSSSSTILWRCSPISCPL